MLFSLLNLQAVRKLSLTQVTKCNRIINHSGNSSWDWSEIPMPKGAALIQIPRMFMKISRKHVSYSNHIFAMGTNTRTVHYAKN